MKASGLILGLIALALNASEAAALSCIYTYSIPKASTPTAERKQFDKQTRRDFGSAEIVAEAKVMSVGETAHMHWESSQLIEVLVTRYLRAPATKQLQDRYYITAEPDALHANDAILFFAKAELEANWQARVMPNDPKRVRSYSDIPTSWTQRIWYAQGACSNPVYPLAAPETAYLLKFVRHLANNKLAPATLTLSFSLDARMKASAKLPIKVVAIDGAKRSRTVRVTSEGTPLDLPAGRYRLHWPKLPGYRPSCLTEFEKSNCELDLVAGTRVDAYMNYQPMAKITLVPTIAGATPVNLLGELEWQRIDAPKSDLANSNQRAWQYSNVRVDELDDLDESDSRAIVPGRYQLYWVVKSYAPAQTHFECKLLSTKKIPVRWRIGDGTFASEHDIPVGHSVVFAKIPESKLAHMEFIHLQKRVGEVNVSPHCADWENQLRQDYGRPLKVIAFRGQQYQLEYGCYGCTPRIETVRKLLQADQDMVLELK